MKRNGTHKRQRSVAMPDFDLINSKAAAIVDRIPQESIEVYLFLMDRYSPGNVAGNRVFQFVFRSFYRMENAGLTDEFKSEYFAIMDSYRGASDLDICGIAERLRRILNRKGQKSLQFSFITKLLHTVNNSYPIYDAEVARVYRFRTPSYQESFGKRLERYATFYRQLGESYREIIKSGSLQPAITMFSDAFPDHAKRLSDVKVLDFIMWSAGKLSHY